MPEFDKNCTVLIHYDKGNPPSAADLQKRLESNKDSTKAEALEELILLMIHGEPYAKLLMTVIRFVVTSNDHRIKKLLMIYWEIVDKCKPDGELKEEMILVCNALRNDLMHANEYIRGSTMRLLCKMRYYKILEPLIEAIMRNLTHRHSYVRRNAVMCVYSTVKSFGIEVIPQAAEEVEQLLLVEGDLSTKRNAFLMLLHCDQDRAINYVLSVQDVVSGLGDIFQLVLLELVRKVCRQNPAQKPNLLRIIVNLLQGSSPAVAYEGAAALVALSSSSVALKAASQAYVSLLVKQADNNVKLIVLDRLAALLKKHKHVLEGFVMDILRALVSPSIDVRRKTLDIALRLISPRNIQDVVNSIKKEIVKTMEPEQQAVAGTLEYRQMLIRAVHSSCGKYPDVAQTVMHLLMDFMSENDHNTTLEVAMFIRELVATYPHLRQPILERIVEALPEIQESKVSRVCLWLVGEFVEDLPLVEQAVGSMVDNLAPMPLVSSEEMEKKLEAEKQSGGDGVGDGDKTTGGDKTAPPKMKVTTRTVILADGTYGTENVYERDGDGGEDTAATKTSGANGTDNKKMSLLRNLVLTSDFLMASMVAVTLAKLTLKELKDEEGNTVSLPSALKHKVVYTVACIYKFIRDHPSGGPSCDSAVRVSQCLKALTTLLGDGADIAAARAYTNEWFGGVRASLTKVLAIESEGLEASSSGALWLAGMGEEGDEAETEPDDLVSFRQLRERRGPAADALDDEDIDVKNATGASGAGKGRDDSALFQQRLAKVQQMTGLADPVYVEAFLQVHQFDLVLEMLVINRTPDTLQNVNVEISTHGDLKIVDRPSSVTLAAGQSVTLYASIKVQSTETGIIFGYVTYDKRSAADKECLVLNEMHIDLLDYIQRSWVGDMAFRTMWSEFEWENKININSTITDVSVFLEHIMKNTNMTVVGKYVKSTPDGSLPAGKARAAKAEGVATSISQRLSQYGEGHKDEYIEQVKQLPVLKKLTQNSNFFAVNLYSKSIFGEDALANLSIEKKPDGKLAGSVRIRSRTQGIALSLGDRITIVQRGLMR